MDSEGLSGVRICPEVMGKINQLGDLEEVLFFCGVDERFLPCVDFGHLNSRTQGSLQTTEAFAAVLDNIEARAGKRAGPAAPHPFFQDRLHVGRRKGASDL